MGIRLPQNPGISGLDELTNAEEIFLTTLAGLNYSTGDIIYWNGSQMINLGIGSDGEVLTLAAGVPTWAESSMAINREVRIAEKSDDINVQYIGKAVVDSNPASAVWQIQRIDENTNFVLEWAGGDDLFDKIWNNREALTYT